MARDPDSGRMARVRGELSHVPARTWITRGLALVMSLWAVFLALDAPSITVSVGSPGEVRSTYECDRPLAYAFTSDTRDAYGRASGDQGQRSADTACRDRAIGSAVTIGLLGVGVALLLGFTRPLALTPRTTPKKTIPW